MSLLNIQPNLMAKRAGSVTITPLLSLTLLVILVALTVIFQKSLNQMVIFWDKEEYSHGYLIPLISAWLIWESRQALFNMAKYSTWTGLIVVLIGLILGFVGELSSLFTITQYAFLIVLLGLCVTFLGWQSLRILWFPLAYLAFMIPLPNFLYFNLSSFLQLISSGLGVAIIRLFDISVHLEGNVIDLGTYQLQVVDACSGLRYLFPLASFGFLCSFFFRAPFWMRLCIFLSTIPITILMNSFRIAMIGILVENFGIAQAEGFLHDFEGWTIFIGCLIILVGEMWLLTRLFIKDRPFTKVFVIAVDPRHATGNTTAPLFSQDLRLQSSPYYIASLLLVLAAGVSVYLGERQEIVPIRQRLANFPLHIDDWHGVEAGMEEKYLKELQLSDYIIANYIRPIDTAPVNFYVAYYNSQTQGVSAHSPKGCMPGDGWRIEDFSQKTIGDPAHSGSPLVAVNRALISKGNDHQLVYYWFQQRGRHITNEYLVKWFLLWDALTRKRTDGALVRVVLPVSESQSISAGDQTLEHFIQATLPLLKGFVPD